MSIHDWTSGGLRAEQRDFFHRHGHLVLNDLFDDCMLQPAIDDIQAAIDVKTDELVKRGTLSSRFSEAGFADRLAQISRESDEVALSLWNGVLHGPGFFDLLTNDRLLDLAESLCGNELIASSVYRLRPKIPHYHYGVVPWHQDSAYFEPYCDQALVLTVWIPLVDTDAQNGCLWVLPDAHHEKILPHRPATGQAYLEIPEDRLPGKNWVCCPVRKGGVLLLHNLTPHCSQENQTEQVRWSLDVRYQNAELPTNAPITRLPGDSTPKGRDPQAADFVPPACHPPEADFLVRSRLRPNEVIRSAEEFARLRSEHQPGLAADRWGQWWKDEANRPSRNERG